LISIKPVGISHCVALLAECTADDVCARSAGFVMDSYYIVHMQLFARRGRLHKVWGCVFRVSPQSTGASKGAVWTPAYGRASDGCRSAVHT
jgi:hypothetical protein